MINMCRMMDRRSGASDIKALDGQHVGPCNFAKHSLLQERPVQGGQCEMQMTHLFRRPLAIKLSTAA